MRLKSGPSAMQACFLQALAQNLNCFMYLSGLYINSVVGPWSLYLLILLCPVFVVKHIQGGPAKEAKRVGGCETGDKVLIHTVTSYMTLDMFSSFEESLPHL